MLKSLEDYLSGLDFDPPAPPGGEISLNAGERAFVEKYLGLDPESMPLQTPEPVPLPPLLRPEPQPAPLPLAERSEPALPRLMEPEIVIAPPRLEVAAPEIVPEIIVGPAPESLATEIEEEKPEPEAGMVAVSAAPAEAEPPDHAVPSPVSAAAEEHVQAAQATKIAEAPVAPAAAVEVSEPVLDAQAVEVMAPVTDAPTGAVAAPVETAAAEEVCLRDNMRRAEEIQVVSFLICGQIFLLPVASIQEVLRHMELVKVPQAPEFVAGAINLRGTVMPLVHLSALLTNSENRTYDEKSFIIVTGSQQVQIGLIIDKVNSMHMIPQGKIIWNVESKLGDAAEFLGALVDLDDKVCGMIEPETITRKLLSEM